jgi:type V secretory pathway adhesin AidA
VWWHSTYTSTDNVTILAGTPFAPTISAAAVCNNITINSGATLTITGTNTLTVGGNWTNSGTLSGATGIVIFNGTAQSISGTGAFTNLTIATGTTTLNANTTVSGTLDLTSGTIDLNTFNLTTIALSGNGTITKTAGGCQYIDHWKFYSFKFCRDYSKSKRFHCIG